MTQSSPTRRQGCKKSTFGGIARLLRYRLVIPVLRSKHSPEYTARAVFIGLIWAMTPTIGIQMPLVFMTWVIMRWVRRGEGFNLPVALAWTWSSNVVTLPPLYYLFLITGKLMMGQWGDLSGYSAFTAELASVAKADGGFFEVLWLYVQGLFQSFGLAMFVGSVPWAIFSAWFGYRTTLRVLEKRAARRLKASRKRRAATSAPPLS